VKVYISADIEGVTGVTHWDETQLEKDEFKAPREQMTAEVVAACEGALQAGATEIWVKDAHHTARNLIAAKLPQQVRLIRGWSGHPLMMVQELDSSFRAAMFIGYHSRAGGAGSPLAHTMSGRLDYLSINGRFASEFLLHGYAAAYVKAPVVFVSGDKGLCDEVAEVNAHIHSVAVKEGIGGSTISIHPAIATARIKEGAFKAVSGDVAACTLDLPPQFTVEARFKDHFEAFNRGWYPGARQTDPKTVQFVSEDYFEVLRFLLFAA